MADRYLAALEATLQQLARHPGLGRRRRFDDRLLEGIRSYRVNPPFHKHFVFYRYNSSTLFANVSSMVHAICLVACSSLPVLRMNKLPNWLCGASPFLAYAPQGLVRANE